MIRRVAAILAVLGAMLGHPSRASAQDWPDQDWPDNATINDFGGVGLLQLPTARMLPDGWAGAGTSVAYPYEHVFFAFQPVRWLETVLRLTVDDGLRTELETPLSYGLDVKFRLAEESRWQPSVALGARNLFGSNLFSGEYLVIGKRWEWLDLMAGIGWGRFAGRGDLPNPLRWLSGHFRRDRPVTGDGEGAVEHLFTGERIGLFAGLRISLPWDLGLHLEYTPDDLLAERSRDPELRAALPVNVGLSWRPLSWLEAGLGLEQGSRIMARLSVAADPETYPGRPPPRPPEAIVPRAESRADADAAAVLGSLLQAGFGAWGAAQDGDRLDVWAETDPTLPVAAAIGRIARHLTQAAPPEVVQFAITLAERGAEAATVTLMRSDLERAGRYAGSPAEIWQNAEIAPATARTPAVRRWPWTPRVEYWGELRSELSLSDQEAVALTRQSLLGEVEVQPARGMILGFGGRLNLSDDLLPPDPARDIARPVRSDTAAFAQAAPARLERAYVALVGLLADDLHGRVAVGWFEEGYAGIGGELLWRPFTSRFAVGIELSQVWHRDPDSQIRLFPGGVTTGHLDLHYRPAFAPLDATLSVGRYLAGDLGASIEVARRFENGIRIGVHTTVSDLTEGRSGRVDAGLRIVLPLQALPGVPPRSTATVEVAPLLRDAGQRLRSPVRIYDRTEAVGYGAIAGSWDHLLD